MKGKQPKQYPTCLSAYEELSLTLYSLRHGYKFTSLQRIHAPTHLEVRRLNAIARKLQKEPQKLIFRAMKCQGQVDIHADSGYRRLDAADDVKGYGLRGLTMLRKGKTSTGQNVVHLLDSICKSHRLVIRSSYGAELLAAAHGMEDAYPTIITLIEIANGVRNADQIKQYREQGNLELDVTLTLDAEGVYKSLTNRDFKTPAEKTHLAHVAWIRELLHNRTIRRIQWCDTRDMVADCHTKGSIDRTALIRAMIGEQTYKHETRKYEPVKPERTEPHE